MTIFVANLNFNTRVDELRAIFEQYGEVKSCKIPRDRDSDKPRGFAFVDMDEEGSKKAISELNGRELGGRQLVVRVSEEKK